MEEKIALIRFDTGKGTYAYRTTITDLKKGNAVNVQISRGRGHKHAEFVEYTDDPNMEKVATAYIISAVNMDLNSMQLNRSKAKEKIKKLMASISDTTDEAVKTGLKKQLDKALKEYAKFV